MGNSDSDMREDWENIVHEIVVADKVDLLYLHKILLEPQHEAEARGSGNENIAFIVRYIRNVLYQLAQAREEIHGN